MITHPNSRLLPWTWAVLHCCILLVFFLADTSAAGSKRKDSAVWLVLFFSRDCPHCERVVDLIDSLRIQYPVKALRFDVDKQTDYELFSRMQSVHSGETFSVPLVIIGSDVMVGETEISARLSDRIHELSGSGGVPLPAMVIEYSRKKGTDHSHGDSPSRIVGKDPPVDDKSGRMRITTDKAD